MVHKTTYITFTTQYIAHTIQHTTNNTVRTSLSVMTRGGAKRMMLPCVGLASRPVKEYIQKVSYNMRELSYYIETFFEWSFSNNKYN